MFYSTRYFIRIIVILLIVAVIVWKAPEALSALARFIDFLDHKITAVLGKVADRVASIGR